MKIVLAAPQAAARVVCEQVPGAFLVPRREIPARAVRARRPVRERAPERVANARRPSARRARRPDGGEVIERLRRRHERAAGALLRAERGRGHELEVVRPRAVEPPEPLRLEEHHAAACRRAAGKIARRADVHAPRRRGDGAVFVRLVPEPAQRVAQLCAPHGVVRARPEPVAVAARVLRIGQPPRDRHAAERARAHERVRVEDQLRAVDAAQDVRAVVARVAEAAERHGVAHAKARARAVRLQHVRAPGVAGVVAAAERHSAGPARLGSAERAVCRAEPDLVRPDEHRAAELGEHLRRVRERAARHGLAVVIQRRARAPEQPVPDRKQAVRLPGARVAERAARPRHEQGAVGRRAVDHFVNAALGTGRPVVVAAEGGLHVPDGGHAPRECG